MTTTPETYAAVDLGSNSFHMVVATVTDGRIQIIDKLKDVVRLAAGLDENQKLDDDTMSRAMECLQRFGQRITDIPPRNVRAVGTNTLRLAKNRQTFIKKARAALGHPIDIISGREEGRLIFAGVGYSNYNESEKRLVVDIGGGSTEVAIGKNSNVQLVESLYMGCVNISNSFFPDGEITAKKMKKAMLTARLELESIEHPYKHVGWDAALGSSGSISTIRDLCCTPGDDGLITPDKLSILRDAIIAAGNIKAYKFPNLASNRTPVLAGGVAILSAVFEALEIQSMRVADGALREGLLLDLIGRQKNQDIREKSVDELISRYSIDRDHGERVEQTVMHLFNFTSQDISQNPDADMKLLRWAARLHEIGLTIAHSQHHKHAGYLLMNSELPGFSREEQVILAQLVRAHRRKLPVDEIDSLPDDVKQKVILMIILLRLAVVLNRSRTNQSFENLVISFDNDQLVMAFPENWLSSHPLTEADLSNESDYLKTIKYKLSYT